MAQTQLYIAKAQVHCIEESSQDTYLAPDGSGGNMFLARNISITYDGSNYEPEYVRGDFLQMDEVPSLMSGQITFEVPIKGSGDAGDIDPEWMPALMGCGFQVETTAGTSHVFAPSTAFGTAAGGGFTYPGNSYSLSVIEDGVRYAIYGAFGNVVFNCSVDNVGMMAFTFTGAFQAVIADALESPTYQTTVAPAFRGASFVGFADTPKGVENYSLDMGNNVVLGKDVNEADGYYGSRIVSRKSTGSYDPEMKPIGTFDYIATQRAGTTGAITTGAIGSAAGNIWTLAVARAVMRPIELTDRDGKRTISVPFAVSSATTDVEGTNLDVTLTLT